MTNGGRYILEDLIKRLTAGEDTFTEFKPDSVKDKELRQTLVAFANTVPTDREAVLFIGIKNNNEIQDLKNPDSVQMRIQKVCTEQCYPPIKFTSEVLIVDDKKVLAVVVGHSDDKPHFSGPAYVRKGSQSVKASKEEYEKLILFHIDKCREILKWGSQIITVVSLQKRLGDPTILNDSRYREAHDCVVLDCKAHHIRLRSISSDKYFSEPIKNVSISFDEKKNRLMLIVKEV